MRRRRKFRGTRVRRKVFNRRRGRARGRRRGGGGRLRIGFRM